MARDWRDARIGELEQQLSQALARIADLERLLGRSSRNSGQPSSTDTPAQREERPGKAPTGRKPGGQPGHKAKMRVMRALLPPEKVTSTEEHFPRRCSSCGDKLPRQKDDNPLIHQPGVEHEQLPTYDKNGVDRSLARFMLSLTPAERLDTQKAR